MPGEWNYRIDGFGGIVTVKQNIDNTVNRVYVDLDSYATRTYTQAEYNELSNRKQKKLEWVGDDEPQYEEYGEGAFAKLKFDVEDGVASLAGVKDDSWAEDEYNWPAWLRLLTAARELVANVEGVEHVEDPQEAIRDEMGLGESITIRGRD